MTCAFAHKTDQASVAQRPHLHVPFGQCARISSCLSKSSRSRNSLTKPMSPCDTPSKHLIEQFRAAGPTAQILQEMRHQAVKFIGMAAGGVRGDMAVGGGPEGMVRWQRFGIGDIQKRRRNAGRFVVPSAGQVDPPYCRGRCCTRSRCASSRQIYRHSSSLQFRPRREEC